MNDRIIFLWMNASFKLPGHCVNVDSIPLEERQHSVEGFIAILLGVVYYVLYIPCIIHGYSMGAYICPWHFRYPGSCFCVYPTFMYLLGNVLAFFWVTESWTELTLVLNRCLSILAPDLEKALFGGKRILVWFSIGIWTSLAWFFNPYVDYIPDPNERYNSWVHPAYDGSIASVSKTEWKMFIQVFAISVFNFVACSIYVYFNYVLPSEFLIHLSQWCWLHVHGFPPVIYLTLNNKIRNDTRRMFASILGDPGSTASKDGTITAVSRSISQTNPITLKREKDDQQQTGKDNSHHTDTKSVLAAEEAAGPS
uniref:Uncharacterized protein n=1 Tax=Ditylenchus dipsaci TaxID=166011 RepID=A0A915EU18_9BILA